MEIMRTLTSSFTKLSGCLLLVASSAFAGDVVLQKVPDIAPRQVSTDKSNLGPQASFALINYNVRTKARTLFVSSGNDLMLANNMIDNQAETSFGFSAQDNSPVAVIDLGRVSTVRRLSAIYSARAGAIDFYLLQKLPGVDGANTNSLKIDDKAFAKLKPIGSTIDDGTQGRASIDFPATTGRYVMLRWSPASRADTSFTVAEVSAVSPTSGDLIAANRDFSSETTADSKDIADSKDVADSKDIPEEGPPAEPPAEGPPPSLPNAPPFTFIPQIVPTSP
jgi:hypothetical protein